MQQRVSEQFLFLLHRYQDFTIIQMVQLSRIMILQIRQQVHMFHQMMLMLMQLSSLQVSRIFFFSMVLQLQNHSMRRHIRMIHLQSQVFHSLQHRLWQREIRHTAISSVVLSQQHYLLQSFRI